mmetsp:Transcript_29963/g.63502  ORF Transcript_29963/g.63502 Transcript_29963/m.63502 type:complete len:304 (-) Transcript_29963:462-1373(-)
MDSEGDTHWQNGRCQGLQGLSIRHHQLRHSGLTLKHLENHDSLGLVRGSGGRHKSSLRGEHILLVPRRHNLGLISAQLRSDDGPGPEGRRVPVVVPGPEPAVLLANVVRVELEEVHLTPSLAEALGKLGEKGGLLDVTSGEVHCVPRRCGVSVLVNSRPLIPGGLVGLHRHGESIEEDSLLPVQVEAHLLLPAVPAVQEVAEEKGRQVNGQGGTAIHGHHVHGGVGPGRSLESLVHSCELHHLHHVRINWLRHHNSSIKTVAPVSQSKRVCVGRPRNINMNDVINSVHVVGPDLVQGHALFTA